MFYKRNECEGSAGCGHFGRYSGCSVIKGISRALINRLSRNGDRRACICVFVYISLCVYLVSLFLINIIIDPRFCRVFLSGFKARESCFPVVGLEPTSAYHHPLIREIPDLCPYQTS